MSDEIEIFTDGACKGNPGPGGWAAIVRTDKFEKELKGYDSATTNNRMELTAAIKGLEYSPEGSSVIIYSDSSYLVNTMSKDWKRGANLDLWSEIDQLISSRTVQWEWVKGHNGHPDNERADRLASTMAESRNGSQSLTHLDDEGKVSMVDVGWKQESKREAVAKGSIVMERNTLNLILRGDIEKGSVFSVARLAGIMGSKKTSELIPLCHQIPIDNVQIDIDVDKDNSQINITATANTTAKTGVEMEALTGVSIAALAIYDMCKAVDKTMHIERIRLIKKTGGESGDIILEKS